MRLYKDSGKMKPRSRVQLGDTLYIDHYIKLTYSAANASVVTKAYSVSDSLVETELATLVNKTYSFLRNTRVLLSSVNGTLPSYQPPSVGQYRIRTVVSGSGVNTAHHLTNFEVTPDNSQRLTYPWLVDEVVIEPYTGPNDYGEEVYSDGVTHPCRVEQTDKRVMNKDGQEAVASCLVILSGEVSVNTNDRITLPDGRQPVIIAVERLPGPLPASYVVVVYT